MEPGNDTSGACTRGLAILQLCKYIAHQILKYYILYTNITTNPILFIFIIFQSTAHDPKWTPRHIFVYSSPPLSSVFLFTSMICEVLYTSLIVFLVSAPLLLVSVPSAPLSSALFSFPWCSSPLHLSVWWSLVSK